MKSETRTLVIEGLGCSGHGFESCTFSMSIEESTEGFSRDLLVSLCDRDLLCVWE